MIGQEHGLHRLTYRSRSALVGSDVAAEDKLEAILAASNEANARCGLTGALLAVGSVFLQVLEGPSDAIEATFERICCDLRHQNVELVEFAPISEPAFGAWAMHRLKPTASLVGLLKQLELDDSSASNVLTVKATRLMAAMITLESARSSPPHLV